jgi:hypothetical protein
LELVLGLPILLWIAAFMVIYGTMACWKVRGLTVARQQLWANRQDRSGNLQPLTTYWQVLGASAPVVNGPGGVGSVSALSNQQLQQPVIGGAAPPAVNAPQSPFNASEVEDIQAGLFDPTRGLLTANASVTQPYPMMGRRSSWTTRGRSGAGT